MNENNDIVKIASTAFVVLVAVPTVIAAGVGVVTWVAQGTYNLVQKVRFNNKIKKGLKDGSIVEINGQYYEVKAEEAEEAEQATSED